MKTRVPALLLTAILLLSVPALAWENSTENFVRSNIYENQFSDLTPDSTFYSNVSALYEYGLSIGKADGSYGLTDSLTVGQAVIFAGRIRSLYRTGNPERGPSAWRTEGQLTAQPYLLYLQAEGVLDNAVDDLLTTVATRAQMAHILANLLPEDALPSVHDQLVTECYASRRFISDVTEYTPYFQDILSLYRKGVCLGSDAAGTYHPDAPITRGAVAAMLTRIIDPSLRVTPAWDLDDARSARGATLASLVKPGTYISAPVTDEELDEAARFMLSTNSNTLQLYYPGLPYEEVRQIMSRLLLTVKSYCEQGYNYIACTYSYDGTTLFSFSASGAGTQVMEYREASLEAAIAVHDYLWNQGFLHESMTEWEIARVYYTWICENCVYDHSADDDSISHIPYSLFANGRAVCDGYTGAYNLLLKLEGIDCRAYFQNDHIWTLATLDGVEYHIDTTWGDGLEEEGIVYAYFAMTPEQSELYHK